MESDKELGVATPFVENPNNAAFLNYQDDSERKNDTTLSSIQGLHIPLSDLDGTESQFKITNTTHTQSLESLDMLGPPPTSPEKNFQLTREYLSLVMSIIYAMSLVTIGLIIHAGNASSIASFIYSIYLCGVGFVFLLYLMIDIGLYKCNALRNQKITKEHEDEHRLTGIQTLGDDLPEVFKPAVPPTFVPLKHKYCFSQGRHAQNVYLKLGAVGFAMGHLVHSMLLISVQLGIVFDSNINNDECIDILASILDYILPCYCILQLYFVFRYSNVIILKSKCLAYFALMHMIGSSLCFWILAIARETILILSIYAYTMYGNGINGTRKYTDEEIGQKLGTLIDIESLYHENCTGSAAVTTIIENYTPYLFPFTVEFNILIVAFYYNIWSNIGNCDNDTNLETNSINGNTSCRVTKSNEGGDVHSNIVIHADCSQSLRGLFAGIMLTVIVIGVLILGFVLGNIGEQFQKVGYLLKDSLKLGLHSSMLIAAVIAFTKLRKLDINKHPMSLLDDVLLFICLPAFILETVLSMIATVNIVNVLKSIDVIIMVLQVLIQTPLIMDGLRRCSNSKKLRRSKPGRELLMFLIIANVSMWLFNTFSYKSPKSLDERYEFYGKVLWTVLSHISLPLIMFYRFHSSVCFADIWVSAYKPGSDH